MTEKIDGGEEIEKKTSKLMKLIGIWNNLFIVINTL